MKRCQTVFCIVMLLAVIGAQEIFADQRPPYDIILVVDKSLSMDENNKIGVVKTFLNTPIIENNVQIGDFLIIMDFWGQAEALDYFAVNSQSDKDRAKSIITSIATSPKQMFTDIGNAIDIAKVEVDLLAPDARPKVVLLLTDGIQEAPYFSKYYSTDGKFTNAFLEKATTIAKQGWKIQVIAIGGSQILKDFTEKIGGQYTQVSEKPTVKELEKTAAEFAGTIAVVEKPDSLSDPQNGEGELNLKLKSTGFSKDQAVTVKEIRLTTQSEGTKDTLAQPLEFTMPKEGELPVTAKLTLPVGLEPGDYAADVQFIFTSDVIFTPGIISLNLHVNSFIENNPLLLAAIIAGGLLLLALLVFLIVKLAAARGVKFRLAVEERPLKKGQDVFKVGFGKWLYLNESYNRLSVVPKRSLRSIGRIYGVKNGLEFEPLREEQFTGIKKTKQNILGQKLSVKTEDGELLHCEFIKIT